MSFLYVQKIIRLHIQLKRNKNVNKKRTKKKEEDKEGTNYCWFMQTQSQPNCPQHAVFFYSSIRHNTTRTKKIKKKKNKTETNRFTCKVWIDPAMNYLPFPVD